MIRGAAIAWALLAAGLGAAAQGPLSRPEPRHAFAAGPCVKNADVIGAVTRRGGADAIMMTAWLSERGICWARNANRAWSLYESAYARGATTAALRLSGLAASPEGGQDAGATLWWARKLTPPQGGSAGGPCDPLPTRPEADESEFLDTLRGWPQDRLSSCRAEVAFRSLVHADIHHPVLPQLLQLRGALRLDYRLDTGHVAVAAGDGGADEMLLVQVRAIAEQAMARVPKSAVPAAGSIVYDFGAR